MGDPWGFGKVLLFYGIGPTKLQFPLLFITVCPRRGLDPNFDYKKMGFVMEACGKQQEEHVISAQSSVNDARKSSLRAAFNLLLTNVANDQCLQDKFLATAEMNSCRARSVLVHSLEAGLQSIQRSLDCPSSNSQVSHETYYVVHGCHRNSLEECH